MSNSYSRRDTLKFLGLTAGTSVFAIPDCSAKARLAEAKTCYKNNNFIIYEFEEYEPS
mgnify:CR=1 FL=1